MKKSTIGMIIILIFVSFSQNVLAAPPDYNGGVNNEYNYEEIVFLSGEPIKFVGEYTVSDKERGDSRSISYNFKLVPEDRTLEGSLSRRINYKVVYTQDINRGQTIAQTILKGNPRESITIGNDKYNLEDLQFSKSDIIDNRPASDFYSGTLNGRKLYSINKDEGTVHVDISGGTTGYENFWGVTETQILDYTFQSQRYNSDDNQAKEWAGNVHVMVSDSTGKKLQYADNEASYSSFSGGHMRVTDQEMVSKYEYDLPEIQDGTLDDDERNRGIAELSIKMLPRIERLIVPKFRDTDGHWAQDEINQLYSLDVFEGDTQFFIPDVPMTRIEFVRAVIKGCDIRVQEEKTTRTRQAEPESSAFQDIETSDPDYEFIKEAINKGVISGVAQGVFGPQQELTRAQAITILIRALGFENRAPNPGYYTVFTDDMDIPYWSRDSIYVAREIGLIQGDNYNRVNAGTVMTRAEASAMLIGFLDFLQQDLQQDYRENIILYN
ncbi:MAG: S-layer homology domain-containing protein [Bacillota bacterium]|nr:S-layer homology domain-containing protein [Bacillota bacterium]